MYNTPKNAYNPKYVRSSVGGRFHSFNFFRYTCNSQMPQYSWEIYLLQFRICYLIMALAVLCVLIFAGERVSWWPMRERSHWSVNAYGNAMYNDPEIIPPNKSMGSVHGELHRGQERRGAEEGELYPCETCPNKDSLFLGPDNPQLSK